MLVKLPRMALAVALCAAVLVKPAAASHSGLQVRSLARNAVLGQIRTETAIVEQFGGSESIRLAESSLHGTQNCDITASGPICYSGRKMALAPPAVQQGLVGHWTFDGDRALDVSGGGNHGVVDVVHGPSPAGSGYSAVFHKNFMTVPSSAQLESHDFTYSFWVYLLADSSSALSTANPRWCPLLRKGIAQAETQQFFSAPALYVQGSTGVFRAEITTKMKASTNGESGTDGEYVDSVARLLPNRWMHVAVVHHSAQANLLIYINGVLDAALTVNGNALPNSFPLYVGGDPFVREQCGHTVYIDELRAYNRAVFPHELQAEAAPALGGTDPSFVRLGCVRCSLQAAVASCPPSRHVCTALEMHTGGYQVARAQGWLTAGMHVWTHAAILRGAVAEPGLGLALCCDGAP